MHICTPSSTVSMLDSFNRLSSRLTQPRLRNTAPIMSIQVTTAPGALVALGIGAGDVASIISLGQRIGNWWTGPSGDNNLLELLDEEASDILKRRGLMDILAFNKRWRKQIRILGNGVPLNLREEGIQDVLKYMDKLL
ncbi:hypothetical protein BKA60DRAFT_624070 [Fusarium oxysporum]|nr:hypothetical protein BKA60DRAFT_624070 [Fusarium oxysporum]